MLETVQQKQLWLPGELRLELLVKDHPQIGFSKYWDIYLPLGMSAIPAGCFKLVRIVIDGEDAPGARIETWQIVLMLLLQTIGIIGMAVVVLIRMEMAMTQLHVVTAGNPTLWRRLCLLSSLCCLAMFDVFLNVGFAFAGAWPLIVGSVFWCFVYLAGIRLTFFRLPTRCVVRE